MSELTSVTRNDDRVELDVEERRVRMDAVARQGRKCDIDTDDRETDQRHRCAHLQRVAVHFLNFESETNLRLDECGCVRTSSTIGEWQGIEQWRPDVQVLTAPRPQGHGGHLDLLAF